MAYGDSIEAMKMMTSKKPMKNNAFNSNMMDFHDESRGGRYSASGYRSNEIDEGAELNKLNALNAIVCH